MSICNFDAINYCGTSSDDGCWFYGRWNGVRVCVPRNGKTKEQYDDDCRKATEMVDVPPRSDPALVKARMSVYGEAYRPNDLVV